MKSEIKEVINSIFGSIVEENKNSYNELKDNDRVKAAVDAASKGDYEDFYYCLLHQFSQFTDGLLATVTSNEKAQFFLKHGNFVERQFIKLIEKYEGPSCSADKSRAIMRKLLKFHMTGELIFFDYNQEYTYHYPRKIFTDHDIIIKFADSVHSLYYGYSEPYLIALADVLSSVKRGEK